MNTFFFQHTSEKGFCGGITNASTPKVFKPPMNKDNPEKLSDLDMEILQGTKRLAILEQELLDLKKVSNI